VREKMAGYTECPKCGVMYKGEHTCKGKPTTPITLVEMQRALADMLDLMYPEWGPLPDIPKVFESAMYSAKTTMKEASERRVFIQDFAAALNRRGLLRNEVVDRFCEYGYTYMEAK